MQNGIEITDLEPFIKTRLSPKLHLNLCSYYLIMTFLLWSCLSENSYGGTTSCPHQPPSQCFRVEAVVGLVKDGLLVGVVALAEPLGFCWVRDAGLGAAARPEGEGDAAVRQRGRKRIMGYCAARLHTFGSFARFRPPHLWVVVGCDGERWGYWVGHWRQ